MKLRASGKASQFNLNHVPEEDDMAEAKSTTEDTQAERPKVNGQPKRPPRVISSPQDVAQLVMVKIDQVNEKKDDLTIAIKGLTDTTKQLVRAYAQQQDQIAKLAKKIAEMEKDQAR